MPAANSWIKVQHLITLNAKIEKFADLVGLQVEHAVGNLIGLWTRIIADAKYDNGNVTGLGLRGVELKAGWRGKRGVFSSAMVEVGLLDQDDADGSLRIHDWSDYAGAYLKVRNGNRNRQQKKRDVTCDTQSNSFAVTSHVTPLSLSKNQVSNWDQPNSNARSASGEQQPSLSPNSKPSRVSAPGEKALKPFQKTNEPFFSKKKRAATKSAQQPKPTAPIPQVPVGEIEGHPDAPTNALSRVDEVSPQGQLSVEVSQRSEGLSWPQISEVMRWDLRITGVPNREAMSDIKDALHTCTVTRGDLDQAHIAAIAWARDNGGRGANATVFAKCLASTLRKAELDKQDQQKIDSMGIKIEQSTESMPLHRLSFRQQDQLAAAVEKQQWREQYGENGNPFTRLREQAAQHSAAKKAQKEGTDHGSKAK